MLRILHIIGSMDCGGAETMIMNIYRNIDRKKIQFDFVVHSDKEGFYEKEIKNLGGYIYRTKKFCVSNYFEYRSWWKNFFVEYPQYKIVHGHICSSAAIYLSVAKKFRLTTVVHSHATKNTEKTIRKYIFQIMVFPLRFIADYYFACSKQAGIDRFGRKIVASEKFQVLENGIDVCKYKFDNEIRKNIREKYNVPLKRKIIGHVGRFTYAKNHEFLIDVFNECLKMDSNMELWLFGEGELKQSIKDKVEALNIANKVVFWGVVDNVYHYLQAMDCFIFPSKFEGLGIALVEAQAAGLHCVVSDAIQKEADIGAHLLEVVDLTEDIDKWVDKIFNTFGKERGDTFCYLEQSGFNIQSNAEQLSTFYLNRGY